MRTTPVTTTAALLTAGAAVLGASGAASASAPSTTTASASLAAPPSDASATPITFAPGTTSADLGGDLAAGAVQASTFSARAGQDATVRFRSGSGTERWVLVAPDGTPLHTDHTAAQRGTTRVVLPATGTYRLDDTSATTTAYHLGLSIPR